MSLPYSVYSKNGAKKILIAKTLGMIDAIHVLENLPRMVLADNHDYVVTFNNTIIWSLKNDAGTLACSNREDVFRLVYKRKFAIAEKKRSQFAQEG